MAARAGTIGPAMKDLWPFTVTFGRDILMV
jgi:hypothetical protein